MQGWLVLSLRTVAVHRSRAALSSQTPAKKCRRLETGTRMGSGGKRTDALWAIHFIAGKIRRTQHSSIASSLAGQHPRWVSYPFEGRSKMWRTREERLIFCINYYCRACLLACWQASGDRRRANSSREKTNTPIFFILNLKDTVTSKQDAIALL